jgi:hypothetical protein
MKPIGKLMLSAASLLLVTGTIRAVLATNQRTGVYPASADSIGIPLAETAHLSVVAGALLMAVVGLSALAGFLRGRTRSRRSLLLVVPALALAYLLAIGFFALWGLSWLGPHHAPIVAACAVAVGAILYLAAADYRSLRADDALKPVALRAPT